jgi:hypothetical protein
MTDDMQGFGPENKAQTENDLPPPLTPADCDLRGLKFMPLDVRRLRDSDLVASVSAEGFRCAVLLWCAAWEQVPAASLPDDDRMLAQLAGFGRFVDQWRAIREEALYGFVLCSDGRWHHPVIAEKAAEAWTSRQRQRERAVKRWGGKQSPPPPPPPSGGPAKAKRAKPNGHDDAAAMPRDMPRHAQKRAEIVETAPDAPENATAMPRHEETDATAHASAFETPCHGIENPMQGTGTGTGNRTPSLRSGVQLLYSDARAGTFERCLAAAGPGLADPAKEAGLHLTAPRIAAAIAAGCDLDADILPVIAKRTAQARASPIATWAYFEGAWIDARDKRLARLPDPDPTRFATGSPDVQSRSRASGQSGRAPATQRAIRHQAALDVLEELGFVAGMERGGLAV